VNRRDEKHGEALQCIEGLKLLQSRLPNVLGCAALVLWRHRGGFQEKVPAGLLSVLVLNVLLDEPHVQANHSPNRSGQFAGGI